MFISNSVISEDQKIKVAKLCNAIILRENKGYDFAAWKEGLLKETWDVLTQYDNVTLMNDTCFGPLFDIEPIYNRFEDQSLDFWGMTNCPYANNGMPGTNDAIPEHVQSYFICFKNKVLQSKVFRTFWENVQIETKVENVIQKYETRLTGILGKTGFIYTTLYDTNIRTGITHHPDLATWYPDLCINNKVPFVKVKSFIRFPHPKYILKLIQEKSEYPVSLIQDAISDSYDPFTALLVCDKLIPARVNRELPETSLKIAVHLHVFYLDLFEQYFIYFDSFLFNFDLFITTDTLEKSKEISDCLESHVTAKKIKEIIITENRGRDIIPWLSIGDRLADYDIVGHFHTKRSPVAEEWSGITWQQEINDLLLRPINEIVNIFNTNSKIGIIIPELPFIFHIPIPLRFSYEKNMQVTMQGLWRKMECRKDINFEVLMTPIMSCGTMFWYRPEALRRLFQLKISMEEVPPEPLTIDGTLLHCIERIVVYLAWNEGFDYRIMVPESQKISGFVDNLMLNQQFVINEQLRNEKIMILRSRSYRLSRVLLVPLRVFRKIINFILK
ncbi:rhamnan synthesis F family protein [Treponema primitia]